MSLYTGCKCDVCGEKFTKEDDVVICPVCGTPHHRSCYTKTNNCVHEMLHEQKYEWSSEDFRGYEKQENNFSNDANNFQSYARGYASTFSESTLDGITTSDLKNYFGNSYIKFVHTFNFMERTNLKKFSMAAFIFGPYYYLFRKMNKKGLILLLISIALLIPTFIFGVESIKYLLNITNIIPVSYNQTLINVLNRVTNLTTIGSLVVHFYCGKNALYDLYLDTVSNIKQIKAHYEEDSAELANALHYRGKSHLLLAVILFIAVFTIIEFTLTFAMKAYEPYFPELIEKIIAEGIRVTGNSGQTFV